MSDIEIVERVVNPKNPNEVRVILANGLVVALKKTPGAEYVYCDIIFGVGSRNEREENAGISHFVEHMVCNGTIDMDSTKFVKQLERSGCSEMRASTCLGSTRYSFDGLSESFSTAFPMVLKFLDGSTFKAELIENERPPIQIERQSKARAEEEDIAIRREIYRGTSYCGSVVGSEANIQRFTREDLMHHYEHYYQPCNTSIVITGDFELNDILQMIGQSETRFSRAMDNSLREVLAKEKLDLKSQKTDKTVRLIALQNGNLANNNMFHISLNFQSIEKSHRLYPAYIILTRILGSGSNSKLFKQLRNVDKICYFTGASHIPMLTGENIFEISATMKLEDLIRCLQSIYGVLEDILKHSIYEDDVELHKIQYRRFMAIERSGRELHGSFTCRTTGDSGALDLEFPIADSIRDITARDVVESLRIVLKELPVLHISGDRKRILEYSTTHSNMFEHFKTMLRGLSGVVETETLAGEASAPIALACCASRVARTETLAGESFIGIEGARVGSLVIAQRKVDDEQKDYTSVGVDDGKEADDEQEAVRKEMGDMTVRLASAQEQKTKETSRDY